VVGGRPRKLNSAHPGQGSEKLGFKLASLFISDDLWATEAGYPAGQESASHGIGCDVRDGDYFWPAGEAVNCGEAVCLAC
jgi:hypothetical protein